MTRVSCDWISIRTAFGGALAFLLGCEPHTIIELPPDEEMLPHNPVNPPEPEPADAQVSVDSGRPLTVDSGRPLTVDSGTEPGALRNRYAFSGNGVVATDSAGDAHGMILGGAMLSDSGSLQLDGVDDYVQLPDGMISILDSTSLMIWATWQGTRCWERLLDFGNNLVVEGRLEADTSVFMTPHWCMPEALPAARLEFRNPATAATAYRTVTVAGPQVLPAATSHHYVVTIDTERANVTLYIDGSAVDNRSLVLADGSEIRLSDFRDLDNWLGRSQYLADPFFAGQLHEVRVYGVALSAEQVLEAYEAGPDVVLTVEQ